MRNTLRLRVPVFLFFILVAGALTLSLIARPRVAKPYPAKRSLLAAYHLEGQAELLISNSSMEHVTITPEVYAEDGEEHELDGIDLQPHEQRKVQLGDSIRALAPKFRRGGLKLDFETADPGVAAQLILSDEHHKYAVGIPLRARSDFRSSRIEGLWHVPFRGARLDATLFNTTRETLQVTAWLTAPDGTILQSEGFEIGPYQARALNFQGMKRFEGTEGAIGGVSIQHSGKPGSVMASGLVEARANGYAASLLLTDPGRIQSEKWFGPGIQLGDSPLGAGRFTGRLLMRNASPNALQANPVLHCGGSSVILEPVPLGPGESAVKQYEPSLISCSNQSLTLELGSSPKGGVIAQWLSTNEARDVVIETPLHAISPKLNLSGSDPFWIDEETTSVLYVTNTGSEEARFFPAIHFSEHQQHNPAAHADKRYIVGVLKVRPGETIAVDIRELRDKQTPDVWGVVLPRDLKTGMIHWLRRSGPALVGNLLSVNSKLRTSISLSFFCCYCSPRNVELRVEPNSVSATSFQTVQLGIAEWITDCHGISWPVPLFPHEVGWDSSNYSVAYVGYPFAPGEVYCGFPGAATVTAYKTAVWYFPDYSIPDDEFCYLDGSCSGGAPPCQSFEETIYGTSNFDVVAPPCPGVVNISSPPDNATPSDSSVATNFSFLAQRSFANAPAGDTIAASATLNPTGNPSQITWQVTASMGTITNQTNFIGPSISFVPNPPAHAPYVGGTGCNTPGNGSCNRSTALSYAIRADSCASTDTNTITQDQVDIIRQEYANHGIIVPVRSQFNSPTGTAHFSVAEVNPTSYSFILGTPASLAEAVRSNYNALINDDTQVQPIGTTGLAAGAVVVGPGASINTIGPILDTAPCNGAPNPATCDDQVSGNTIVAGSNGIAETRAVNQPTNFGLILNSAWRNPERNEAFSGVINSRHQFGNAVDLDVIENVPGKSKVQLICILETAANLVPATTGFAERFTVQVACSNTTATHVHVQQ